VRRRDFITALGSAACIGPLSLRAQQASNVDPRFLFEPPLRCLAGVRPYRATGYRLLGDETSDPKKFIVHNYGHGGAGITMSWGVASKVRDLVKAHVAATSEMPVAVLGSGVMGLTAATLLRELGLQVTIYAEKFWSDTTSAVAGGQWAPSVVTYSDEQQFKEVLKTSYEKFAASIGQGFGVSKMPNYTIERHPSFDEVLRLVPGLLPEPDVLPNLPFQHLTSSGFRYHTLLVQPPIFLKRLDGDLRAAQVAFVQRTFSDLADVLSLQEGIIVNCTGYGAKQILNDTNLQAIKGQLAMLTPQRDLDYLFGRSGYLFPRADAVVVGGTFEEGDDTTTPDRDRCQQLVNDLKGVFGLGPPVPRLAFHIDHPKNLRYLAPEKVVGD